MNVEDFYEAWRGRRCYSAPLINDKGELLGNHGDRLMVLGAEIVHRNAGLEMVDRPEDAELLMIGGNGGMFGWRDGGIPAILRRLCHDFPDTPVVMEPATFFFPEDTLAGYIGPRSAPVALFCREQYSHDNLMRHAPLPECVTLHVDDDMAFRLRGSPLVERWKPEPTGHTLLVERVDMEHPSAKFHTNPVRKRVSKWLPRPVKRMLYPAVTALRAQQRSPFREKCESILAERHPEAASLPKVVKDVSNVNTGSFDDFCAAVAGAEVVFTTRLHVGIFASMLGRQTYIFDGPYHKIRGIYEKSLAPLGHVDFVESGEGWTVPDRARRETPEPNAA